MLLPDFRGDMGDFPTTHTNLYQLGRTIRLNIHPTKGKKNCSSGGVTAESRAVKAPEHPE